MATFRFDLRKVTNREALIAAIGTDPATFDAVLGFVPPPPRIVEPLPEKVQVQVQVQVIEIPVFFRHVIPKRKRKGEFRTVWEPALAKSEYKALARRLDSFFRLVLSGFPHDRAFDFLSGRNIRENATVHAGHRNLLCLDVKDFFPAITVERVADLFVGLGVEADVATLLARFVTIGGSLAPGLPTSPVLSNALALTIDVPATRSRRTWARSTPATRMTWASRATAVCRTWRRFVDTGGKRLRTC